MWCSVVWYWCQWIILVLAICQMFFSGNFMCNNLFNSYCYHLGCENMYTEAQRDSKTCLLSHVRKWQRENLTQRMWLQSPHSPCSLPWLLLALLLLLLLLMWLLTLLQCLSRCFILYCFMWIALQVVEELLEGDLSIFSGHLTCLDHTKHSWNIYRRMN